MLRGLEMHEYILRHVKCTHRYTWVYYSREISHAGSVLTALSFLPPCFARSLDLLLLSLSDWKDP